jgi:hypothetical protein
MAAVSMLRRPDAGPRALWLADAVLATASDGREADRRSDSAQRLGGGRPRLRPTAAAAVCSNVWSRSAQRVGSRVGRPSACTGFSVMGRRARPKELLALDAPAADWREWMGRAKAVIFAAGEPVSREGTRRPAREQLEEAGLSASKRCSPARLQRVRAAASI